MDKPPIEIEKYLEDRIIEYLQSQKDVSEGYLYDFEHIYEQDHVAAEERRKATFIVEELLNDLLVDVERTVLYQEEYNKTKKKHHQYTLFELEDIIPGFALDEDLIKQLCFRETLLISNADQSETDDSNIQRKVKPKGVGGLCLKVELVRGLPPSKPAATEEDIDKNIAERLKRIKQELARATTPNEPTSEAAAQEDDSEAEKLKKYETFLEEQSRNAPYKFVVHLSSEFDVDGRNAGSRIVSWVDQNFHTLEERRTEYIFNEEKKSCEQVLYFALQNGQYFVKHRDATVAPPHEMRRYYPLVQAKDLVGEGANFVLMRYLAVTKFKGTFELSTVYINGELCRNIYECRGPRPGFVNRYPVNLCKIYRYIIEQCGLVHVSVTVLTEYGMIVSQEWEGCPYIIHINPLFVTKGKPEPYNFIALKKVWETNMELVSKYLDCKVEAELKMKTYLKDHPEIQDMMADYLQSVLLLKPESIMPFTLDYFSNFEPFQLPQMAYFDEFDETRDKEESEMFW